MAMDPHITVPQNPSVPNAPQPAQPAPEGPPILTKDDLKHIQDQDIYLATRDPQTHEGLKATMREAIREGLAEAGVLTTANFEGQIRGHLDQYFRDRSFEADREAERLEPPGA